MILDKLLIFGSDDSVAAVTSSATLSDYYADMGTKKNHKYHLTHAASSVTNTADYGEGGDLWFNALVTTSLKASSSATFTVALVTYSSATSLASGTVLLTKTTSALHASNATTGATAGDYLIRAKVPAGAQRYLGCLYDASADKISAGKISSWLSYGTATEL